MLRCGSPPRGISCASSRCFPSLPSSNFPPFPPGFPELSAIPLSSMLVCALVENPCHGEDAMQAEMLDIHPSTTLRPYAAILLRGTMLGVGAFRRLAIGSGSRHRSQHPYANHVVYRLGTGEHPADPCHCVIRRLPQHPDLFQACHVAKHDSLQRTVATSGRILRRRGTTVR